MTEILKTKEYSIFKKNIKNRDICKKNLDKLVNSIKSINMLDMRPIEINENMEVIDGQHRLEAAKILNIEVFYVIRKDLRDENMILLNNCQKSWSLIDYSNFYAKSGNENYIKFNEFIIKNNITHSQGNEILFSKADSSITRFKRGLMEFPENHSQIEARLSFVNEIIEKLKSILLNRPTFIRSQKLFSCLSNIYNCSLIDPNLFKKKVIQYADKLRSSTTQQGYYRILLDIYNYKNHNKVNYESLFQYEWQREYIWEAEQADPINSLNIQE